MDTDGNEQRGRRRPQTSGACECEAECGEDDVLVQQVSGAEELVLVHVHVIDGGLRLW